MMQTQLWLVNVIIGAIIIACGWYYFIRWMVKHQNRKELEAVMKAQWYESHYANNNDGIITVDLNFRIVEFNKAAAAILGLDEAQFHTKPIEAIASFAVEEERERLRDYFMRAYCGEKGSYETAVEHSGGLHRDLSIRHVPLKVGDTVQGSCFLIRDITEEKQTRQALKTLAFQDELTGLPNRRKFTEVISRTIDRSLRESKQFVVMVIDVDGFKAINDSLGHYYGDQFLREMGMRIRREVDRAKATVARIGGDEFMLLLEDCDAEEASYLVEHMMHALQTPYHLDGKEYKVTVSIGISIFPHHGQDQVQLLKRADSAMYAVKRSGKNNYQFFQ